MLLNQIKKKKNQHIRSTLSPNFRAVPKGDRGRENRACRATPESIMVITSPCPTQAADKTLPTTSLVLHHGGVQSNLCLPPGHLGVCPIRSFGQRSWRGRDSRNCKGEKAQEQLQAQRTMLEQAPGQRQRSMDVFWDGRAGGSDTNTKGESEPHLTRSCPQPLRLLWP